MAPPFLLLFSVFYLLLGGIEAKTWVFAVSGNRRPFNYIDRTGKLVGFDLDLISKVCGLAEEKCATTVQPTAECTQTVSGRFFPGRGIMSSWFDACMGYTISQDRVNSMSFTLPYLRTGARLAVRPGNPRGVTIKSLRNNIITHLNGAYTNRECLTRLNLSVHDVIVASNISVAKEMVLNGTVDALFSPRTKIPDLQTIDVALNCDLGGVAVMVPKKSKLPEWWNEAFEELLESEEYIMLCEQWRTKSNTPIKCFQQSSGTRVMHMRSAWWSVIIILCVTLFLGPR